ncbi:MAG: sigma 54-interacting transcriptional regulator [Myxococcota bacterium]
MPFTQTLRLARGDNAVQTYLLDGDPLEVGSNPRCEIHVDARGFPERAWLVVALGRAPRLYNLAASRRDRGVPMPAGRPVPIGHGFTLTRLEQREAPRVRGRTDVLRPPVHASRPVSLVYGRGPEARAVAIEEAPVSIGSGPENTLTLPDRAVSRSHCRLEPHGHGVSVRDLDSTNGTWVDGVRVRRARLRPGAVIRVGRTRLRVAGRAPTEGGSDRLVAASGSMLDTLADVDRFAALPWPVLVCGETGVGKELVARALHERSPRREGPFVAINGGGLPGELIESELFGHERGAFTGAVQSHRGAFERAHEGTLFLDEIAELAPSLQSRLLRVLETWQVRRVGGEAARRVDVRLVCATHRDLARLVSEGQFRADLYYRVHRLVIRVAPLRQRPADITPIANHVLHSLAGVLGEKSLSERAAARLRGYSWPGNTRELRNTIELAAAMSDAAVIGADAVDEVLRRARDVGARPSAALLRKALADHGGNYAATARAVGIPRSTLRDRLKGAG